ncbi:MAG: alpha-amylase family glycosyl hydrolase [Firmicutes bacterium]|nr:alpha-amylase family glycosyl hydrolase [Bacillota bacterium]
MKKLFCILLSLSLCVSLFVGCAATPSVTPVPSPSEITVVSPPPAPTWQEQLSAALAQNPLPDYPRPEGNGRTWYQVFVYSFCDSNGDGVGDLNGVTSQLEYIKNLGFDGIWLSPIHPAATYHKYDVIDYYGIDPQYGTMADFDALIAACDKLGLKVLMDLVLNHSSDQNPWFSAHPEYYNIQDQPGNGNWKQLPNGKWYECQFWEHMPDFNLENPDLRLQLADVAKFWLDKGVAGFRLDAVKDYEGGNVSKDVEILKWFSGVVYGIKPDAYLVGEAWDTTNALYDYYRGGIDSFFAFSFAGPTGTIAQTLLNSDGSATDYLSKVIDAAARIRAVNPNATAANFFTNHDMARAAGFLRRDPNLIKTAWGMNLTQPGDAFVYYGEELGMSGSGKDENKRAPMFWTDDPAAEGMTLGPPGMEPQENSFPPAAVQAGDGSSILSYVRQAVRLRAAYPAIARGSIALLTLDCGNPKVAAVARDYEGTQLILVYNLSADAATAQLPGSLTDYLSATGAAPALEGGTLQLPGYTIAILRAAG